MSDSKIHDTGRVFLILGICFGLATGCGREGNPEPPSVALPSVETVALVFETVTERREWQGVFRPLKTSLISAPEDGDIVAVHVSDGAWVERGDLLIQMEGPEWRARQEVLQQRLAVREAELERWERLAESGAAGPSEIEEARLRVLEVRESLAEVESRLRSVELRSPVAGRIAGTTTVNGARVARGEPLVRVEDLGVLGLRLRLPASEWRYLAGLNFLTLILGDGREIDIDRIVSPDDAESNDGFVVAEIWSNGGVDWPAEATLVYTRDRETLVVPWTAVARDEETWVAVVAPGDPGDPATIERRVVGLGSGQAHGIEVVMGLQAGERVVRFEPRSHPEGRAVAMVGGDR